MYYFSWKKVQLWLLCAIYDTEYTGALNKITL